MTKPASGGGGQPHIDGKFLHNSERSKESKNNIKNVFFTFYHSQFNKKKRFFASLRITEAMQKNYGFTLAEVLITLGIVGIIVALPDGSGFSIYSLHVYFCPEYKKCEQVLKENQNKNLTVFLHKLDDYPVKF